MTPQLILPVTAPTYLIDTSIFGLLDARMPPLPLIQRFGETAREAMVTSTLVAYELLSGAQMGPKAGVRLAKNRLWLSRYDVLPITLEDATCAATIRASLAQEGLPIGAVDTLLAGQALDRGLTLVTANTRHFKRVDGLSVEDWSL